MRQMGELKPYLAVFIIQLIYSGLTLLSKAAFNGGMNTCVFISYRQLTGTVIMVPLALILERKRAVPVSLSFFTFCKIFVFFISWVQLTLALNMQAIALVYTSATLAAAIVNSLPASTFFFAVQRPLASYKGPQLRTEHHILSRYHHHHSPRHEDHFSSWQKMDIGFKRHPVEFLAYNSEQPQILESYPAKLKFSSLQCLSSSIQSFGIDIAFERDIQQWKLGGTGDWGILLLASLGDRKERTIFPSNVEPTEFYTCYNRFDIVLGRATILGRITLSLDIYGIGLIYTSATLAAATTNCLPAITFFLALLLRIESLKIKTTPGIAKLIGVVACLAGAATFAFYKGPSLKFLSHFHLLDYHKSIQHQGHAQSGAWIKGCFLMLLSNTFFGLWLVLQTFIIKGYPSKLLFTTIQCFLSSIQSFVIALAVERDIEQWKLGWNVRLLAVLYCGIMVTGVTYYLQTWVIEKKGPVFLAMSTPLVLIITTFASATILGEIISLGSLLGGFILILGLYSVLWGKSKEHHMPKVSLDVEQTSTLTSYSFSIVNSCRKKSMISFERKNIKW
ncbi:WAT1-related protein [Glycine soja]